MQGVARGVVKAGVVVVLHQLIAGVAQGGRP